jgi:membrane protein implicated in regulation of membrane protease activity
MREIIEGIVVVVFILLIFIYHIFESREKHLRVFLDGTYWNAVSRDDNRSLIKVDDKVQVTNIENLKLIVVLA